MKVIETLKERVLSNTLLRVLIPPFAGLLFYGSWAFWVNLEHGLMAATKAAATQGGYSFTITLVLSLVIEWLFRLMKHMPFYPFWVGFIACILLYSTSYGVNALTGTPNVILTILPGAAISTIYTVLYIVTLKRLQRSEGGI